MIGDEVQVVKEERRACCRCHAHVVVKPPVHADAAQAQIILGLHELCTPVNASAELCVAAAKALLPRMTKWSRATRKAHVDVHCWVLGRHGDDDAGVIFQVYLIASDILIVILR